MRISFLGLLLAVVITSSEAAASPMTLIDGTGSIVGQDYSGGETTVSPTTSTSFVMAGFTGGPTNGGEVYPFVGNDFFHIQAWLMTTPVGLPGSADYQIDIYGDFTSEALGALHFANSALGLPAYGTAIGKVTSILDVGVSAQQMSHYLPLSVATAILNPEALLVTTSVQGMDNQTYMTLTINPTALPEPSSLFGWLTGVVTVAAALRRTSKRTAS